MATNKNGIMGAYSGKIGPVIAYTHRGRQCMRGYNPWPKNPRTKKQQANRSVFGTLSGLASSFSLATEIGLQEVAERENKPVFHFFISLNRHCISVVGGETIVDYPSLKVADGTLGKVEFGTMQSEGPFTVGVDFATPAEASYSSDDYVYLFAYEPQSKTGVLSFPVARSSGHASLTLPGRWTGREVHIYGFVWNHNSMASPSNYLGVLYVV